MRDRAQHRTDMRKGHSVSVIWRGAEVDSIFGFEKEADALLSLKEKPQGWLTNQK